MSDDETPKEAAAPKGKGRAPRATREQLDAGQRRRRVKVEGLEFRNWYDDKKLDLENFVYRFAVNTPQRMHALTVRDDYDRVTDEGTEAFREHHGGVDGATVNGMVLLKKPKSYFEDDHKRRQDKIADAEREAIEGKPMKDLDDDGEGGADAHAFYKPQSQNSIGAYKP